jgi:tetratricopeptide (TPR) repeat protein/predicted Ser/Thr protein kinase
MSDSDRTLPPDPDRTLAAGASSGPASGLPDRIGRYRPLRILGQGGMGVVYEAEQEEPRRRVALKVIRPELATEDLRRRFAHESLFLGRLQHPGIAQVYEAGTAETVDGPLPFIAMELVDGVPLNDWLRAERPDRATRIELMIRLCDAVQHAHQRGLIHRDLKPANVLVDGTGRPRVLDFGVARPHDADLETSMVTTHGELVGTLAYMSPEQLAGDPDDIDTRSDVYALGVILYELLAEAPPIDLRGRSLEEVLRAIRETDPPSLASRDASLAGDLTVIAATAMAKDRAQRYASANGLGMDLRRFLDDEPIAARPPSTVYQLRKFARRHRPLVIGMAGVAAALVLGVVASTWQAVRATRAEQLAETRLEQAESVTGFLQGMLAAVQPEEAQGRDVTVREVLDRAANDLDAGQLRGQPEVELALRRTLGETYGSLGHFDSSIDHLERGLALADSARLNDVDERRRVHVALARSEYRLGNIDVAEQQARRVLDRAAPTSELASEAVDVLAEVAYTRGHWAAADSLWRIKQEIAVATADADSLALAYALLDRSFAAEQRGDIETAMAQVARTARIHEAYFDPDHPRMLFLRNRQGDIAKAAGQYLESVGHHEEALRIAEQIYEPDHISLADALWRLGLSYHAVNRLDDSVQAMQRALAIRRQALGPDHRDIALTLETLGAVQMRQGDFDAAGASFDEGLAMRERLFGRHHVSVVSSIQGLGHLARARGEPVAAEEHYEEAIAIIHALPDDPGGMEAMTWHHIAMVRQDRGEHASAGEAFQKTIDLHRAAHGDKHVLVARSMSNLATSLFRQGRKSEAADLQRDALAINRELGLQGTGLLLAVGNAAFLLNDAGRYEDADPLYREYIELAQAIYGDDSSERPDAQARYCANLIARELWDEAEAQYDLFMAWRAEHLELDDPKRRTGLALLAEIRLGQGRLAEAEQLMGTVETFLAETEELDARVRARTETRVARVREGIAAAVASR